MFGPQSALQGTQYGYFMRTDPFLTLENPAFHVVLLCLTSAPLFLAVEEA